jgi:hypothetical protein
MADLVANIRAGLKPLLDEAEGALERRQAQYPAMVSNGRMDAARADKEIRIWSAIVADWRRVVMDRGDRGDGATVQEKIAALVDAVGRFDAALSKEIRANARIQRDCAMGADAYMLRILHGDAVSSLLDLARRRDRIEVLKEWYRQELPGQPGLYQGIDDYLAVHQNIRARRHAELRAA